jgi:hypothetical protein
MKPPSTILAVAMVLGLGAFSVLAAHAQSSGALQLAQAGGSVHPYEHTKPDFKLRYPDGSTVNESYVYPRLGDGVIKGVAFTVPAAMAKGTNLAPDSYFSVEWRDGSKCTIDQFLPNADPPKQIGFKGVAYQLATANSGAAGNSYDETVYLRDCFAVRYFIHSSNVANYPPGSVKEFDRARLMSVFDDIRKSMN